MACHGDVVFPDTGDFHRIDDVEIAKLAIPAGADLRIVAPKLPVNIDYIDLYDTDKKPVVSGLRPPAPPVAELREKLFAGAYGNVEEILFATRTHRREHWYANFGYYCYGSSHTILNRQGRLVAYNLRTKSFRTLLEDVAGAVRDPCVHYDGKQIVFSYRPGNEQRYHLFTINSDGTGLKQLTFGEYDDIEPAWLPDGDIIFVSGRARRWVNCWLTQVATIYRMKPDGSGIRMLSANIEHDNTPWPLHDGRIAYMRWEYVDRRQVTFHHLWTMNPDGTQHQILHTPGACTSTRSRFPAPTTSFSSTPQAMARWSMAVSSASFQRSLDPTTAPTFATCRPCSASIRGRSLRSSSWRRTEEKCSS